MLDIYLKLGHMKISYFKIVNSGLNNLKISHKISEKVLVLRLAQIGENGKRTQRAI